MNVRFCPRCRADVEDVGGFCLLGHRFAAPVEDDPIADLRSEVDRAFEKVQVDIKAALDLDGLSKDIAVPVPTTPEPAREDELMLEDMEVTSKALWKPLEDLAPASGTDPIAAFAPAPRMDWGPERSKGKRRAGFKRPRPA
jgi:hypothetical protein